MPRTLFQKQLQNIMTDDPSTLLINDLVHIQMHKNAEKDDKMLILVELFNMVGLDTFIDIIDLIDGRQTKFPTREEFKDTVETAICYYYKNFKNYDWTKIESLINDPDMKSTKMGMKVAHLQTFMQDRLAKYGATDE